MKFKVGTWVMVTRRSCGGPDLETLGKIVAATRDYAVAECWTRGQKIRFTLSEDTEGIVFFRRAQHSDFKRRR